jgi:hypothetical protein
MGTRGGKRAGAGNKGYAKMEYIKTKVAEYSDMWWEKWEKLMKSKRPDDWKFAMSEFNKLQTKMIPQVVAGDEEGGPLQIKVINYGNNPAIPVRTTPLPAAGPASP